MRHWNRVEILDENSHIYSQSIFLIRCCLGASVAVVKYDNQNQFREVKVYFIYISVSQFVMKESRQEFKQARNLEAGTSCRGLEGVLLTGFLSMACSVCFL